MKFPWATHLIVTADSEEVAKDIADIIRLFLKDRGLELSREKTLITHIDDGFDFLGWNFRKYNGKLLIKPSNRSIETITKSISNVIKKGKALSQSSLIKKLNPIIVGWSEYHRSVVAKETFSKLDFRLWNMLWTWAKRRHPNKSHQWIVNRYWHRIGSRNWVFSADGCKLKSFVDTKIIRHPCLKMDKNPYVDREYFKWRTNYLRKQKQMLSG